MPEVGAKGGEDAVDMEELIRKHQTDFSTLPPDVRAKVEAVKAEVAAKRAAGQFAPPRDPRDNYAIGLDDNFNPFPILPNRRTDVNAAKDEGRD